MGINCHLRSLEGAESPPGPLLCPLQSYIYGKVALEMGEAFLLPEA